MECVNAADYSAIERLRDGREVEIRALRPADRAGLREAVDQMSVETLQLRFFAPRRIFTGEEVDYYLNVDFVDHVALVAVLEESGRTTIVGGGRYIVAEPGRAEVAFAVDDRHQRLGIATCLLRHLVLIARAAGIGQFFAEVLPYNAPMLRVFARSGLAVTTRPAPGVVDVYLTLSRGDAGPGESDTGRKMDFSAMPEERR